MFGPLQVLGGKLGKRRKPRELHGAVDLAPALHNQIGLHVLEQVAVGGVVPAAAQRTAGGVFLTFPEDLRPLSAIDYIMYCHSRYVPSSEVGGAEKGSLHRKSG